MLERLDARPSPSPSKGNRRLRGWAESLQTLVADRHRIPEAGAVLEVGIGLVVAHAVHDKVRAPIPAREAFRPVAQGGCRLVR